MKVPGIAPDEPLVLYLLPGEFARADAAGQINHVGNELWSKDPRCRIVLLEGIPSESKS